MMGFAVIVGAALAAGNSAFQQFQSLLLGFGTGFFLTGAAMAINDYYDREIDAVNEPKRPIPSGEVTPNEALILASFLTIVGLAAAIFAGQFPNWRCLAIASISWGIMALYATRAKRTGFLGNLLVSICIATPFIYGSFVVGRELLPSTSVFVVMVLFSNTGREVTKGIADVQGDKANNVRTVAVVYGVQKAAMVAAVLYLSAVILTPLPWIWGIVNFWFLPFVILTDAGLILSSILLNKHPSRENARKIKNRNLLWFFTALLAFVAGTLG